MIRTPNGKNLMNLQEAVQWLLDNNALPFQCTANYVGGAEIGLGTIVNPTPAKVRVGSLIFFADSKVSTVIAITSNSFICSDEYNDLVDDVVYVSNVQLNASGHLIVTLSNGTDIDAGLIKQVTGFSINDSQHLIVSYNDGTSTDLGAIFSGNVIISGNLTVTGTTTTSNLVVTNNVTAPLLKQTQPAITFEPSTHSSNIYLTVDYAGVEQNGEKITFVIAGKIGYTSDIPDYTTIYLGNFRVPLDLGNKLVPMVGSILDLKETCVLHSDNDLVHVIIYVAKSSSTLITPTLRINNNGVALQANKDYAFRSEVTFLLSDSIAS